MHELRIRGREVQRVFFSLPPFSLFVLSEEKGGEEKKEGEKKKRKSKKGKREDVPAVALNW